MCVCGCVFFTYCCVSVCAVIEDMESNISGNPGGETIKRKKAKQSIWQRLCVKKITGSCIQADEVEALFGPDFLNCPQKSTVGHKLIGSSADEVMEQIIDQLQPVGYTINELEVFNKIYSEKFPMENQTKIQDIVEAHDFIFKDVEVDGKDPTEQMAAFKKAITNISGYVSHCKESKKRPIEQRPLYRDLLQSLIGVHPLEVTDHRPPDKSSLHRSLVDFWLQIWRFIVGGLFVEDIPDPIEDVTFAGNGACTFSFDMEISDEFLSKMGKDKIPKTKTNLGPHGDASDSLDDNSTTTTKDNKITKINILAKPDLSAFTTTKGLKDVNPKHLFLVAEFKGPVQSINEEKSRSTGESSIAGPSISENMMSPPKGVPGACDGPLRTSPRLSSPPMKRKKYSDSCENKDEVLRTNPMCTQHFLELLCAIKNQNNQKLDLPTPMYKCYGIYCVKHRIYITCLSAVNKQGGQVDDAKLNRMQIAYMIKSNTPEQFKDCETIKLRMVSTDYLDMTNSIHMSALLRFIAVLAVHESQNM